MNSENPYQPSQIAQFQESETVVDDAWIPEEALGAKWLTVCKGAANCYTAVAIPVVSSFIAIALYSLQYAFNFDFPPNTYSIFGLGLLYAWLMQIVGLVRMGKVSRASGAKVLMIGALILFLAYWVLHIASIYATYMAEHPLLIIDADKNITEEIFNAKLKSYRTNRAVLGGIGYVIYTIYTILLMLGIRSLGIALRDDSIRSSVMKSLWLFVCCVIVVPVTTYFLVISAVQPKLGAIQIGAGICAAIAIYVMLDFYGKSLKKIADYTKMFAPVQSAEEKAKAV